VVTLTARCPNEPKRLKTSGGGGGVGGRDGGGGGGGGGGATTSTFGFVKALSMAMAPLMISWERRPKSLGEQVAANCFARLAATMATSFQVVLRVWCFSSSGRAAKRSSSFLYFPRPSGFRVARTWCINWSVCNAVPPLFLGAGGFFVRDSTEILGGGVGSVEGLSLTCLWPDSPGHARVPARRGGCGHRRPHAHTTRRRDYTTILPYYYTTIPYYHTTIIPHNPVCRRRHTMDNFVHS
jgi:hypothetical protein